MSETTDQGIPLSEKLLLEQRLTRVAVVQLAYHPAIRDQAARSPLEDPLFEPGKASSLLPQGMPAPPAMLQEALKALRARLRSTYNKQLLARVQVLLATCRKWGVQIAVFPEYSLSHDLLMAIAEAAGDMVIVAGTHSVDRSALRANIYEQLGAESTPLLEQSVCPVLRHGRLLALLPKLNPARPELPFMKPGDRWRPVEMPAALPGPMGVLLTWDTERALPLAVEDDEGKYSAEARHSFPSRVALFYGSG